MATGEVTANPGDVFPVLAYEESEDDQQIKVERLRKELSLEPLRCGKCPQCSRAVIAFTVAAVVALLLALVLGIVLSLKGMMHLKNYNLKMEDYGVLHLENVQIRGNIVEFHTPAHSGLDTTDTWHDFETHWTGIMDQTNSICFIKALNRTAFLHLDLLEEVLEKTKDTEVILSSPVENDNWIARPLTMLERRGLSLDILHECVARGMPLLHLVQNETASGCQHACVPRFALERNTTSPSGFTLKMVSKDCISYSSNCQT
ncbi:uncharacterized protein LOC106154561 [Lingula anatina]|uniref:Uncharacterized protein LOC106154561 n=1 Tax=Lingula anatina TaxID=7574 RepID=A0A1S3HHA2_LINAN|nr:uncharacterized protein LOC106154561 [Lingula anatina]|eukprot:XP_013384409.1 uncharacterized protein LOC106154561 [Lingula anatina]